MALTQGMTLLESSLVFVRKRLGIFFVLLRYFWVTKSNQKLPLFSLPLILREDRIFFCNFSCLKIQMSLNKFSFYVTFWPQKVTKNSRSRCFFIRFFTRMCLSLSLAGFYHIKGESPRKKAKKHKSRFFVFLCHGLSEDLFFSSLNFKGRRVSS